MGLDIIHAQPVIRTKETIDYFLADEFNINPDFLLNHKHLITFLGNKNDNPIPIIFYREKGYLRKQVKNDFIKVFENDKLYFDLDAVKKAYQFLEANAGENQNELENFFKENFIDNFIEGESVFFISW